jgi:hypothetical protein
VIHAAERVQVEALEQVAVDAELQLLIGAVGLRPAGGGMRCPDGRRRGAL